MFIIHYILIHVIIFVQQKVGDTAVPTHMFKFIIVVSESGEGTLVTGAFVVRKVEGYGYKKLKNGNEAFNYVFQNEVTTDIKTIARDTEIWFDEMLKTNRHKYNEELLKQCSLITADELKSYEEKHIREKITRQQKQKAVPKLAEKQSKQ